MYCKHFKWIYITKKSGPPPLRNCLSLLKGRCFIGAKIITLVNTSSNDGHVAIHFGVYLDIISQSVWYYEGSSCGSSFTNLQNMLKIRITSRTPRKICINNIQLSSENLQIYPAACKSYFLFISQQWSYWTLHNETPANGNLIEVNQFCLITNVLKA